jgi:UPF0176 protein
MSFVIAAFYHFFDFPDYAEKRAALLTLLKHNHIKGSLLIASEGINGTLSGTRNEIDTVLRYLELDIVKAPFIFKESYSDTQPFGKAKVRLKKETISLGEIVPTKRRNGEYVEAQEWNRLIADPDTVVIDARNSYEVHLGTFKRAIDPRTKNFKQLPAFVREHLDPKTHKNIATFCTGGIRCEKFSSWLLEQGFENVYQLKGGILKYLEDVPEKESKWQGECYVFDERVAVGHGLTPSSTATMCKACGHALTEKDRMATSYSEGNSCPYCSTRPR